MAYAVMHEGKLQLDTVYEHAALSKLHWLSYYSGDYDDSDFHMLPGRLDPSVEFEKYPDAVIVPVTVSVVPH